MSKEGEDAPEIKVGVFAKTHFVETVYLRYLPRTGDYIQLPYNQKNLAWKIEAVVFISQSCQEWDIVVVIDRSPLQEPTKEFYYETQVSILKKRGLRNHEIRIDRERFCHPNDAWLRRKGLYDRIKAGESVEAIAEAEGMTLQRVKILSGDWRRLLTRLFAYKDVTIGGRKFDITEGAAQ